MNYEPVVVGLIITLVLGGYTYTYLTTRDIRAEIARLWVRLTNHYEHRMLDVERRLNQMDARHLRDHGPES